MEINNIFPNGLDIRDALDLLRPVLVYILGMTVYAVFVFRFYRFVASRDMFQLNLAQHEKSRHRWVKAFLDFTLYILEYIILFPVFAFFWFAVLTAILTFLSKGNSFSDILLMALATVSAIRVSAYYNEDLSKDLAKILPFAVLAIFLIDASFFTVSQSLDILKEAEGYTEKVLYYLGFLIALEFALRLIYGVAMLLGRVRDRLLKKVSPVAEVVPSPSEEGQPAGDD